MAMKKDHVFGTIYFIMAVMLAVSSAVGAEEIRFEATVSRNIVSLGQSIQLNLAFQGTKDVSAPELSDIDGFQSRYTGPSTMMSIVNGRLSSSITHIYRLVPLKTGKFRLGPFSLQQKGKTYVSNDLVVEVIDSASGRAATPHRQRRQNTSLKERVFLTMHAGKDRLYINEPVPLTIKLYISGLSVRDIQYPEFSYEGFSAEQLGKPKQYQERKGSLVYDVVEFNTEIFGTNVGTFSLGPATIQANLVLKRERRGHSDGFFGRDPFEGFFGGYRTESIELKSDTVELSVLSLPDEGRPPGFQGALGGFDFHIEASPREVIAGDPVTLKMTVSGKGNFTTVQSPVVSQSKDFKVYGPQTKQEGNRKIFEQVVIPLNDAVKEIPSVSFSFFDTESGKYSTISRGPVPISVTKPETREVATIIESAGTAQRTIRKEDFGRDIIYIKESPGKLKKKGDYFHKHILFLLLQTVPLWLLLSAWTIQKRREKISTDIGYARRLRAPRKAGKGIRNAESLLNKNQTEEFYDSVFKTLREYLGDRFHLPSGGMTGDIVDSALKDRNVNEDILLKLGNIFKECDMARYAPSALDTDNMRNTLNDLREVIDHLERHK
jgi:hypothetical protein